METAKKYKVIILPVVASKNPEEERSRIVLTDGVLRITKSDGNAHQGQVICVIDDNINTLKENTTVVVETIHGYAFGVFTKMSNGRYPYIIKIETGSEYGQISDNINKILASTRKEFTPDSLLPETFVEDFVKSYNDGNLINHVTLKFSGEVMKFYEYEIVVKEKRTLAIES